jgi:hypothetical protein
MQPLSDNQELREAAERIYREWDQALAAKSVEDALALYAPDATIESPLVCYLLRSERGIVRGHDEMRPFLARVFAAQPAERRHFRTGFFTDGHTLMWEYPRAAPDGEQMDFAEVMELESGLIQRHRVYWGWFGVRTLSTGTHRR